MKSNNLQLMKRMNLNSERGISMVEMMVVVLIFMIIVSAMYTLTAAGNISWQTNKVKIELQQELRKAIDYMVGDLRQAGSISIVDVPADGTWYDTITFKIPAGVTSGHLIWSTNTIQYVLGGTGNDQIQRILGASNRIVSNNVNSMQFRRFPAEADTIQVALQAQDTTTLGLVMDYDLQFKIQMRN